MKTCFRILSLLAAAQGVSHAALVAHWNMDETTHGSTITDSMNGLVGTPTATSITGNYLIYGQASVPAGTYGMIVVTPEDAAGFGTSIQFVRESASVGGMFQIGNPAVIGDLAGPGPSGSFTVMAWVNASVGASSNHRIFATGNPDGWGVGLSNVDQVLYTSFAVADRRSTTAPSSNNVWQHVAYTWNDGEVEVFINGLSVFTASAGFNDETNPQFGIGALGNANADFFNGRIDELKIYGSALSASEIVAAAVPEPSAVLLGGFGVLALLRRRR